MGSSPAEIEQRRALAPRPEFPPELPISAKREEIARAISSHQVVIVCGETGSGKTTQLPKICLDLGRGIGGLIGHTQPRRIAARATASRVAQELKTELGGAVGYKIRFTDKVGPRSYIKIMTDGILLAETQGRSEEHTSELQSRSDLVCRLLLEKKKNKAHTESTCKAVHHDYKHSN